MTTAIRQFGLLTQWQLRRNSTAMPLLVLVQTALAVATIVGYGLLIGDMTPEVALFLSTGAPTVTLVMVGLVMTPQTLAQAKTEGSAAWMRTLPVPRSVFLFADLIMWTMIALPGLVLALVVAMWRYDISLSIAWWAPLAALAISLTAAAIGYAIASLTKPLIAMLLSQLFVFVVLLFSPISYPASRLPEWFQTVHEVLPLEPMGQFMRAGLAQDVYSVSAQALVVLAIWCGISVVGAGWALRRQS